MSSSWLAHSIARLCLVRTTRMLILAIITTLAPSVAQAAQFSYWTDCAAVTSSPIAPTYGVQTEICNRYTFVRGRWSSSATDFMYLVDKLSTPIQSPSQQPLVFLDLDSSLATLHFAVSDGDNTTRDTLNLRRLRTALDGSCDFPIPYLPKPFSNAPFTTSVELLVDSEFFALANRIGIHFPVDDGLSVFSSVAVISIPELNMILVSAGLTEAGRRFFQTFVEQGISGLDAVLNWRIHKQFSQDVNVSTLGWFPCVKAGTHIVTQQQLREIDPRLLDLPINLSNVTQLVNCL